MIIWLASYPKSGNTMLRTMLSSYLFSEDGAFNFELMKNIKQFPNSGIFDQLGIDFKTGELIAANKSFPINENKITTPILIKLFATSKVAKSFLGLLNSPERTLPLVAFVCMDSSRSF